MGMSLDNPPVTIPGSKLRSQREGYGVRIQDLAAKLRHHRNTIRNWENEAEVDVRRQRLYLAALRQCVEDMAA